MIWTTTNFHYGKKFKRIEIKKEDLTYKPVDELSKRVFADKHLFNCHRKPYFLDMVREQFTYTEEQVNKLFNDIVEYIETQERD